MIEFPGDLEVPKSFKRRLRKKSPAMQGAILRCIKTLLDDPKNHGLAVHQLDPEAGIWEAKIDEGNRLSFERGPQGRVILRNHCNHDMLRRNP